jgi:hypothetical protein
VGLRYRTIRAAASALLVAAAVGTGGMAGMTSVLAAAPATVGLAGTVVDSGGAPLAGIPLTITEMVPPDGGAAAVQATTAADGTFSAELQAWGTAAAPATLTIKAAPDAVIEAVGDPCSQTWGVELSDTRDVAFADAPPEPLTLTATTTLLGEVCGTTGVPQTGSHGSTGLTPPPTDTVAAPADAAPDRLGPALTIGFVVGLLAAAAALLPRRRIRRRD